MSHRGVDSTSSDDRTLLERVSVAESWIPAFGTPLSSVGPLSCHGNDSCAMSISVG
jgi:hypothetical protein